VLHANLAKPQQLKAIVNAADREALDRALRTTTFPEGFTPLMEALRSGNEETAATLLQFWAERHGYKSAEDGTENQNPGALAGLSQSEGLIQSLFNEGLCVALKGATRIETSPLHNLSSEASLRCVKLLKVLYPRSCGTRLGGSLPLEAYLARCLLSPEGFERPPVDFREVLFELAALDLQGADTKQVQAAAWERFSDLLKQIQAKERTRQRLRTPPLVSTAIDCLVELGYLEAYEALNAQSGLARMLQALWPVEYTGAATFLVLWPLREEPIAKVLASTKHWSSFSRSQAGTMLLQAASHCGYVQLVRSMLDRGMDLHHQAQGAESGLGEMSLSDQSAAQ
jgi:hypothetical protein